MHKRVKRIIATAMSTVMILSLVNGVAPKTVKASENEIGVVQRLFKDALLKEKQNDTIMNEVVRVIVTLKAEPALKTKTSLESIKSKQEPIQQQVMMVAGAKEIVHSFGYLINGFSLDVKRGDIDKLRNLPGVQYVVEAKKYYQEMNSAKELTQAYNVWNDLGLKGENTVVAVIDSGLDAGHKDMRLSDPSKIRLTKEDIEEILKKPSFKNKGAWVSEKVPYVYDYANLDQDVKEKNNNEPHGMHVAGIVGANAEKDEEIEALNGVRGVAPECQIISMKIFDDEAGTDESFSTEDSVLAAIDDAALLKVDVINMSIGLPGTFQTYEPWDLNGSGEQTIDLQQEAITRATDAGVTVVCSAGNATINMYPARFADCPDTGLNGTPGIAKDALQVASYDNTFITKEGIEYIVDNEKGSALYTTGEVLPKGVLTEKLSMVDCGFGKPADFNGKDLKGKIALIKRGEIDFITKKLNAQIAGALGCIVYNKDKDNSLMNMATDEKVIIPCIFVGNDTGLALVKTTEKNGTVEFKKAVQVINPDAGDMSDFSSFGLISNLEFKPQITAPGGNIYSLANDDSYGIMSGTSMASPHVAGSQALIAQAVAEAIVKKELILVEGREKVEFMKNTAIVTAEPKVDKYHKDAPYSPRRQGAGMIQTKNAINNRVIIKDDKGNSTVALKQIGQETNFNLTLKNYSNKAITYNASILGNGAFTEDTTELLIKGNSTMPFDHKIEGAEVKIDKEVVVVEAGQEATVNVSITLPVGLSKERYVEGFVRFESDDVSVPAIGTPFVGFYGNWSKPDMIDSPSWEEDSRMGLGKVLTKFGENPYTLGLLGKDKQGNEVIDPTKIAISGKGLFKEAYPSVVMLRGAKQVKAEIVDESGKVIRTMKPTYYVPKSNTYKEKYKMKNLNRISWNGLTDDGKAAPQGQYRMILRSILDYEGASEQTDNSELPIKIDLTNPEVKVVSAVVTENQNYKLEWTAKDDFAGTMIPGLIKLNGVDVEDADINGLDDLYSAELKLKQGQNQIEIETYDYAGNFVTEKFTVTVPMNGFTVSKDSFVQVGDLANATFTAENKSAEKKDVTLIMAVYDKNNTLLNYVCVKKNMDINEIFKLSGQVELPLGAAKVKCFIWDTLENMVPLLDVEEIIVK